MRVIAHLLILLLFFCVSCKDKQKDHEGETLLVEIEGNFLYKEDIQKVLPFGLSNNDSIIFADNYIHNWIKNILLYDKAKSNIPNNNEIDVFVENYRHSLIIQTYQRELIKQRLLREVPEQEVSDYYDRNNNLFLLDFSLLKGLLIQVPLTAPQIDDVRKWYKTETYEAVEKLEKYSFLNAVNYLYFYDKWKSVAEILGYIPLKVPNLEQYLKEQRQIEWQDDEFYYFLNISEFCGVGEVKPYEFAKAEIKEVLLNEKQIGFMEEIKNDLFHQAEQKNKIIYYNKKE